jgi:hypothetical protein
VSTHILRIVLNHLPLKTTAVRQNGLYNPAGDALAEHVK